MLLEMHLLKVLVLEVNVRGVSQMDNDDGSSVNMLLTVHI